MAKKLEKKHPLAIRWFHWLNFPLLFIMIWSGLLIYWANDAYRIGWGPTTLFKFFPESFYRASGIDHRLAEGMGWHFLFMWFFAINGLLYFLFTLFSGQWRLLVPNSASFKEAIQVILFDLKLSKKHPQRRKYNGAQQLAYTGVVVMGLGSLLTGIAIYKPVQASWLTALFGGYQIARAIHFGLTVGFILFFLVHIVQVLRAGWNNFRGMLTGHELVTEEAADGA